MQIIKYCEVPNDNATRQRIKYREALKDKGDSLGAVLIGCLNN